MSDMTIEQTLMRSMKTSGGLTQGRGITDSTIATWTLGMVHLQTICEQVEAFCCTSSETSEQHVDMRPTRKRRDNSDVEKISNWFASHQPFEEQAELVSLSSGIVATDDINCHLALEVGTSMLSKIIGSTYDSLTFKRKDKILPLSAVSNRITVDDIPISINPLLLFQRICLAKQSNDDLKDYFCYELAPYPMSIFTECGMRKGTKSTLYNAFTCLTYTPEFGSNTLQVIDGGYLLHRVVWQRDATFEQICRNYVAYVQRHFTPNVMVVFDGYECDVNMSGTKSAERLRRAKSLRSPDIFFEKTTRTSFAQEKFLSNSSNKHRLIAMLKEFFLQCNISVHEAVEDADTLIVNVALENASFYDSVIITGEDIDLLVLLTGLGHNVPNVYFRKPGRGRCTEQLFSANSLKYTPSVLQNILFLHAFGGCDTTSPIYKVGKVKLISTFERNEEKLKTIQLFNEKKVDKDVLASIGERFMVALFSGDKNETSVNAVRFKNFLKSVSKTKFNLCTLPPTEAALRQHTFRTYFQVQLWLGNHLDPVDWGWQRTKCGLEPIVNTLEPAPALILQLISCKCRTNCGAACGCRKAGLKCSTICINCNGDSCDNVISILNYLEEDELTNSLEYEMEKEVFNDTQEPSCIEDDLQINEEFEDPGPYKRTKRY